MALSRIGNERNQLTEATFASNSGTIYDQCNLHYDQTLEELVRMHSWNCCKKRKQLNPYKININPHSSIDTNGGFSGDLIAGSTESNNMVIYTTGTEGQAGYIKLHNTAETTDGTPQNWNFKQQYSGVTTKNTTLTTTSFSPAGDYAGGSSTSLGTTITLVPPAFEYDYSYRVPSDAIRSFYLTNEATAYKFLKPRVDWYMEGKEILTNYEKAYLCYEGKPEPTDMDSLFAQAFICFLAYKLAIPLHGDRRLAAELLKEFYEFALPEARRVNGFERLATPEVDSEWLEATITSNSAYSNSYPPFSQTSYGSFE